MLIYCWKLKLPIHYVKKNSNHLRVDSACQVIFWSFFIVCLFGTYYLSIIFGYWKENHFIFRKWFLNFGGANKMKLKATNHVLVSSLLFGKCGECTKVQTTAVKCKIFFVFWLFVVTVLTLSCVLVPWSSTVDVSNAECKTGHAFVL